MSPARLAVSKSARGGWRNSTLSSRPARFALGDGVLEAAHDLRRQQRAQGLAVALGEGGDDHLVGRPCAPARNWPTSKLGSRALIAARGLIGAAVSATGAARRRRRAQRRRSGGLLGAASDATAEHRVELEQHDRRQRRQDNQFQNLHDFDPVFRTLMNSFPLYIEWTCRPSPGPAIATLGDAC